VPCFARRNKFTKRVVILKEKARILYHEDLDLIKIYYKTSLSID
jgi:hypothetical protein